MGTGPETRIIVGVVDKAGTEWLKELEKGLPTGWAEVEEEQQKLQEVVDVLGVRISI